VARAYEVCVQLGNDPETAADMQFTQMTASAVPDADRTSLPLRPIRFIMQVLSDGEKRQIYDLEGIEGLENHEKGGQRGGGGMSPFDMFFGGQQGGRRKGPDAQVSSSSGLTPHGSASAECSQHPAHVHSLILAGRDRGDP
jgi:hypothetical protein